MAVPDTQTAILQNTLLPAVLQSFLAEICSKAIVALVHSGCLTKGCCGTSTITCMTSCLHHGESRGSSLHSFAIQPCTTGSISSDIEEENASEKCEVSILDEIPAPQVAGKVSRQHFSEWLLAAKNKDDEDEDDEEDEDDDDDEEGDEDDEEGDDEEGDDEEGGDAEGGEGNGDEDEEEDEADDDDDEEDDDEEDDDDEDESPPKKLKK